MGRAMLLKNGLTQKQDAFKNKILEQIAKKKTINGTEAALAVYDTKDKNVAKVIASENLTKPAIKDSIEEALNSAGLSNDQITQNLGFLANFRPEKVSADVVLKANVEILKLRGGLYNNLNKGKGIGTTKKVTMLTFDEAKHQLTQMSMETTDFLTNTE